MFRLSMNGNVAKLRLTMRYINGANRRLVAADATRSRPRFPYEPRFSYRTVAPAGHSRGPFLRAGSAARTRICCTPRCSTIMRARRLLPQPDRRGPDSDDACADSCVTAGHQDRWQRMGVKIQAQGRSYRILPQRAHAYMQHGIDIHTCNMPPGRADRLQSAFIYLHVLIGRMRTSCSSPRALM